MSKTPDGLLGPADVRALAGRLGVRPTKSLGQNFVSDANTVRRIVRRADLTPDDVVVEVGPGLGSLTIALLDAAASVVAVEVDPVLAAELPRTVRDRRPDLAPSLTVLAEDALAVTTLPGPPPTVMVANLPYNVAVPVLLTFLERFGSIRRGLVMVQAEVADRLAAAPGSRSYGVPSVKTAWYARVDRDAAVPRSVFWPVPNVDSALVSWRRHDPPASRAGRRAVFSVVDAAFAQRRKTLRAALAPWAGSAALAERVLRTAGIDPGLRGERLPIGDFARIADARLDLLGPDVPAGAGQGEVP
ncbi:MAG: 16S rRNA (adenine(1518)-N(6)/adenine(1519)-N(6))-dimethyltransferase RsmA [Actinomycetes bacterium]